jgi:putative restriction endonuclease
MANQAAPFIALTDKAWFDYLASIAIDRRVDEVDFWSPKSTRPMKAMSPGTPVFFRLKRPHYAIAGYGFFAHFALLDLDEAWTMFGEKNGDPDLVRFLTRIGDYRGLNLLDPRQPRAPIGCTVLRDAIFWERERWIPWRQEHGWHDNIVQGRTEDDPARISRLLGEINYDHLVVPGEFTDSFLPLDVDERELVLARSKKREGQGAFRSRLLDAYGRRCAITGERTEPVLDAAHIQPYLGPSSNHLQNGLLLSKEFHALFDRGLVTVTPQFTVRVSPHLRERWKNGKRYYQFDQQALAALPDTVHDHPAREALAWHNERIYLP